MAIFAVSEKSVIAIYTFFPNKSFINLTKNESLHSSIIWLFGRWKQNFHWTIGFSSRYIYNNLFEFITNSGFLRCVIYIERIFPNKRLYTIALKLKIRFDREHDMCYLKLNYRRIIYMMPLKLISNWCERFNAHTYKIYINTWKTNICPICINNVYLDILDDEIYFWNYYINLLFERL